MKIVITSLFLFFISCISLNAEQLTDLFRLDGYANIKTYITDKEREFYKKLLLQVDGSHVQNELFDLFQNNSELYESDSFNLYSFIDALMQKDISEELERELVEIKKSEQVLTPYVYLFKNLQSKPFWEYSQIDIEPIFNCLNFSE